MALTVEKRQFKRCAAALRLALTMDDDERALAAVSQLEPLVDQATPAERVDFLERAAVWASVPVVDAVFDRLGPFAYRGWALALALRCAREDVARDLMARGVDLLEPAHVPEVWKSLAPSETALTRFDLTRDSSNLLLNPQDHSVCTEVFLPFSDGEQLVGSDFSRGTDIRATCDLVGRLAVEGLFDSTVFDDLFRAAMATACDAYRNPTFFQPQTPDACLALAREMLYLHEHRGMGTDTMRLTLGNLITPQQDERIVAFVCRRAPTVFLGRLAALSWLRRDVDLVKRMVPYLTPGTEYQNGVLLGVLAGNACFDQLESILGWDDTFTPGNLDRAIDAASQAGHAEVATWLLTIRQDLTDTAKAQQGPDEAADSSDDGTDADEDLGDLSGLLL